MTIATMVDQFGTATARIEAEGRLRDAATALLDAFDDYERVLETPAAGRAESSIRSAEMRLGFAQQRVQQAAVRARNLQRLERSMIWDRRN
jgi:hypothetical protein